MLPAQSAHSLWPFLVCAVDVPLACLFVETKLSRFDTCLSIGQARRDVDERDPSVDVRSSWDILEELDMVKLQKLSTAVKAPEDIVKCGSMEFYDKKFGKIPPCLLLLGVGGILCLSQC